MVEVMLDHGADINIRDEKYGQTPLYLAARFGRIEVVKKLIDRGAQIDADVTIGTLSWTRGVDSFRITIDRWSVLLGRLFHLI